MLKNPNAEKEREDFERFGQEIPASLWPPELADGAKSWYEAFWDLCSDRPSGGMQLGRISYMSARMHCRGWPEDEFHSFWRVIRAMDEVFLQHANSDGEPQTFTRESFRGAFSGK